jgi:selenocysteine-specific elongation factor
VTIIGTAGHVDHGKSTLVQALTGIDPDRLAEEKRRGMTLDLGFAHLDLPSGKRIGIIDVPGHARLLHNMLAGVHGLDAVLLVVAADEGVRPQTREHLDILGLVDVNRVVVALTKTDLVEPSWLPLVTADVRAELSRRGLEAEVIPVSAPTREGLDQLMVALTDLSADIQHIDGGRPRLPVDRVFSMAGFGTVVTGSLVDGQLRAGQELELVPAPRGVAGRGARVRIRGMQQHGRDVQVATPGSRVALNLQGVHHEAVRRGQVLAPPATLVATDRVDVRLRVLPDATAGLRHNVRLAVHAGTAETSARLVLLEGDEILPAEEGWVQLRLAQPLALRDGDRLVLRRPSLSETVAGGAVMDATPPLRRRHHKGAVESLQRRLTVTGRVIEELQRAPAGLDVERLAARLGTSPAAAQRDVSALQAAGGVVAVGLVVYPLERWRDIEGRATAAVDGYHRAHPLRWGMPREGLRAPLALSGKALTDAIAVMLQRGTLEARGSDLVGLPGFAPRLTPVQQRIVDDALAQLQKAPLSPPGVSQLAGIDAGLSLYLEESGRVTRLASDVMVMREAVDDAVARVREHLAQAGTMTVAQARDLLGSSRKVVVPLLEYMDAARITIRRGDVRHLR